MVERQRIHDFQREEVPQCTYSFHRQKEEVEEFNHTKEELDEGFLAFLRTGAITLNTTKGIQTGKKIQQKSRELRGVGSDLKMSKTPEDAQKSIAEGLVVLSEVFLLMEEMMRRNIYVSASSGLFSDRAYTLLRKIEKKRR